MPIDLYPNIAKVKRNGAYQNLPGFVQQSCDADIKAMIANEEISTTAQYSHPKGSYFILNDILYKATIDIVANDTIAVGTNCDIATIGNDLYELENDFDNMNEGILGLTYIEKSYNLLNIEATELNKAVNSTNGTLTNKTGSICTEFIPIGHKTYLSTSKNNNGRKTQTVSYYAYYDTTKTFISGGNNIYQFEAPSNAAYIRCSLFRSAGWTREDIAEIEWMIIEKAPLAGGGLPYIPYSAKNYINANDIDTAVNLSDLFAISNTKNILSYANIINSIKLNTTTGYGEIYLTGCATDYIEIKPSTSYYISHAISNGVTRQRTPTQEIVFYDVDKEFISSATNKYAFTTPSTAKYVRLSWHTNDGVTAESLYEEKAMVEEGESFTSYYSPDGTYKIKKDLLNADDRRILTESINVKNNQKQKAFMKRFIKASHRGVMTNIPQNTIPAFEYAATHGYDAVEFDVQITSDNEFVIWHDQTITIDSVTKRIDEFTLAEIKTYRFASYAGTAYEDTEIPTLEETLVCCIRNNLIPFIEIKQHHTYTQVELTLMYNICKTCGFDKSAIWLSSVFTNIEYINYLDPWSNFEYMINATDNMTNKLNEMRGLINGTNTIWCAIPSELITEANVTNILQNGADYIIVGVGLGGDNQPVNDSKIKYVKCEFYNVVATT